MSTDRPVPVSAAIEGGEEPTLWVEMGVEVDREAECPLAGPAAAGVSGSVQLVTDSCHVSLSTAGGDVAEEVRTYATDVDEDCICPSFCRPGCVPEAIAVDDGSLAIGAYADSRETLAEVMAQVRENASHVRLRRLTTASPPTSADEWRHEAMEPVTLTEKQREAVQTAVEMGYYATPRSVSLADLADRLGVTRSAISQRLTAVETKLVTALVTDR
ncbi:MAG: helix-turn-helix domain-containing protein [Halobacteriota archaeon]